MILGTQLTQLGNRTMELDAYYRTIAGFSRYPIKLGRGRLVQPRGFEGCALSAKRASTTRRRDLVKSCKRLTILPGDSITKTRVRYWSLFLCLLIKIKRNYN